MEWTGIMGFTKSGDPFVGPVQGSDLEGQFVSAGFSGHGMPRAFACAQVLAEMISSAMSGTKWSYPPWLPRHYLTPDSAVMVQKSESSVFRILWSIRYRRTKAFLT